MVGINESMCICEHVVCVNGRSHKIPIAVHLNKCCMCVGDGYGRRNRELSSKWILELLDAHNAPAYN